MSYKMETFEERKVRYIEKIKNLTMMSDILARNVLKDKECCEYILRIIMNDRIFAIPTSKKISTFLQIPRNPTSLESVWSAKAHITPVR